MFDRTRWTRWSVAAGGACSTGAEQDGGGRTFFAIPPERIHVLLYTAQHEALMHEAAHALEVYWRVEQPNKWAKIEERLLDAFLAEANEPLGEYPRMRQLCRDYRDGTAHDGWPGMWNAAAGAWRSTEIWAGLISAAM